jgi:hypothetical protein
MAEMPHETSDAHLRLILGVPKHWLLHFVGLSPVSTYTLREALVEAGQLSLIGHVMQRIIASSGDILINPEQIARISGADSQSPTT